MRLAEDVAVEYGDLVGADHQVLRIASGQRFGLAGGKAAHQFLGTFPGVMAFVDIGAGAFEGKAQAGQEFASVGGAGGEDQVGHEVLHGERPILTKRLVLTAVYG